MACRGLAVVAVMVLICGGCAERDAGIEQTGTPSSTASPSAAPTGSEPWAQSAINFFDGWAQHHPRHTDRFYAPNFEDVSAAASYDASDPTYELRLHRYQLEKRLVFMSERRVALLQVPLLPEGFPARLHVFEMAGQRIASEAQDMVPVRTLSGRAIPRGTADELALLYDEYLEAWESGAPSSIGRLYQPGATRHDELLNLATTRPSNVECPTDLEHLVGSVARYTAVEHPSWRDNDSMPPVYTATSTLTAEPVSLAYAEYRVSGGGCELQVMAEWTLEDSRIHREEVFYEVRSLRQCADLVHRDLPSGWWTDLEAPDPFAAIVTAQLETRGGNVVQIANGTWLQTYVVQWALDRLAAAGLDLPPTTIVFPPVRRCLHMGPSYAVLDPVDPLITLCLEDDIVDGSSLRLEADTQRTVLHEMGHVWLAHHVDEALEQEFLGMRELDSWADADLEAFEQGIEQAADIFAWGLMNEPLELHFSHEGPEDLATAFRLLTGVEAICPQ